jgi:hypothetical protein
MVDAVRGVPSKLRDTSASYPGLNRASWFWHQVSLWGGRRR